MEIAVASPETRRDPARSAAVRRLVAEAREVRSLAREGSLAALVERLAIPSETGPARALFAWQKPREILAFLRRFDAAPPRVVVEIGTGYGGTLVLFARIAAQGARIVSIDLDAGRDGEPATLRGRVYRRFAREGQRIDLLQGDSTSATTRARLVSLLDGAAVDLLFIDGAHDIESVRRDFSAYAPLVRPGGCVALHDIRPHPLGFAGEVWRVWEELAARFASEAIVDPEGPPGYGIGILRWEPAIERR